MVGMHAHTWETIIRILLALLFGGLVGLERELSDHPAGIRTHILVTVGACAFTAMSLYGFPGFPGGDRVAAAIVTGIGFIGGGAILKSKDGWVTGLTTAASLWSCAAIGMLVGGGFYVVGLTVTVIDLIVLELIDLVIDRVSPRFKRRTLPLDVRGRHSPDSHDEVLRVLSESGSRAGQVKYNRTGDGEIFEMFVLATMAAKADTRAITDGLFELGFVSDVTWGP